MPVLVIQLPDRSTGSPIEEALPSRRSLVIQYEHVFNPERRHAPRPSGTVHKLYFRAVRRQQLNDGSHVARLDVGVIAFIKHGDQVEKLRFSSLEHRQALLLYSI